jgi:hypothetical protein
MIAASRSLRLLLCQTEELVINLFLFIWFYPSLCQVTKITKCDGQSIFGVRMTYFHPRLLSTTLTKNLASRSVKYLSGSRWHTLRTPKRNLKRVRKFNITTCSTPQNVRRCSLSLFAPYLRPPSCVARATRFARPRRLRVTTVCFALTPEGYTKKPISKRGLCQALLSTALSL